MTGLTEQALRAERKAASLRVAAAVVKAARRVLEDAGVETSDLATASGYSETRIGHWWDGTSFVPLWLAAAPWIPDVVATRLVGEVLALRSARTTKSPRESALSMLVAACGEALVAAGKALADGVVDDAETRALRPIIAQLHERCAKWLRDHGGEG